ncbi:UDP-N-acetylglucosamine 2-epimerase (hydrolyzing) [Rhizobium laguerreae]|uniref:UDP-N-acetylglucosamine 2-epimerase n=1 Tax=Rhizobium laguerreae TaxID=1076926 RepID=UPI0014425674|nr:UDP-N-acetylglucosamine 2-epimerase [Rhizobium laguerreae]MBY3298311.1 UDP-N-acetylglucosamine 2-epimerase (hydrolyzing) [Rhizobium laguerreae]MBY3475963.1 UDP-N-acetylglucosamine 2-epimerase (hydrolyzing) [Rhizobium laguerreae]MBY3524027.1 UDP-N-acetylglucosamine 2-epimerase (hydrolyzing) [Rhizobium laguerreae]MBY3537835.1 UDP-N-acetylglucosamine 2-epimerase (hydrolyzing) [Rhizobium laguerreae]NKM36312.1 UDP-N-acetylglucosamine 2-epimerase (hydrolyzing) [Rhizobium laguerreae]
MTKPRICVTTGTRADYGLLYWLMHDLHDDPDFELQIAVSAMHLSPAFGETVRFIRADGFKIDAEIPCLDDDDSDAGMARAFGRAVDGFRGAFEQLEPDFLVILGDRFEALAAATAATFLHIPVGHIHGGEVTLGAMDDTFRHAITKMAHLHFTAAGQYADRVIQMGEAPERVFNIGAIGLDNFRRLSIPDRLELMRELEIEPERDYVLMTYHPATMDSASPVAALEQVLEALQSFPDLAVIITKANSDPGGRKINARLETFHSQHRDRVRLVASLGQLRYLAAMKHARVVLGNSSSGLIEAPAVDVPTVNVGPRQLGRLKAMSVIDTVEETGAIVRAMTEAMSPSFRDAIKDSAPPYGRPGDATGSLLSVLRKIDFARLLQKPFYDLPDQALKE